MTEYENEFDYDDEYADDEEEEEEEEEEDIDMYDYFDYPFAMEIVNGEIISFTKEYQRVLVDTFLSKFGWAEDQLAVYFQKYFSDEYNKDDDEEDEDSDSAIDFLNDYEISKLASIFGYDETTGEFATSDFGFLNSELGWTAKDVIESLGFQTYENINRGPHGHGSYGVIYIPKE